MYRYTGIQVHKYTGIQVYRYTAAAAVACWLLLAAAAAAACWLLLPAYRYTGIQGYQLYRYTGTFSTSVLVHVLYMYFVHVRIRAK